jgi:hypothetical protein
VSNILEFDPRRGRDEARQKANRLPITDGGDGMPPASRTWLSWRASVDARLESLKGSIDGTRWVVGIVAVVMIGGFSFLGFQLNRLEGRVDRVETAVAAIPARLSDEFRAMRAEMAAQTNAIANSITATRQSQPPPPQIIVIPAPQSGEKSPERRP